MFLYGSKDLRLQQYTSASVNSARGQLRASGAPAVLRVTPISLAVGMAKSTLTADPSNSDLRLEALEAFLRIQRAIDTRSAQFRISETWAGTLRDFSQKARIGELAQGLSFLFAQQVLNFPIVLDYGGFLSKCRYRNAARNSPDYALLMNNVLRDRVSLLEAKGTLQRPSSATLKRRLRAALTQCASGTSTIRRNSRTRRLGNSYGALVAFAGGNGNVPSTLSFADPDSQEHGEYIDQIDLIRFYYASWFSLLNRPDIYLPLADNEAPDLDTLDESFEYGGRTYLLIRPQNQDFPHRFRYDPYWYLGTRRRGLSYGISAAVWKVLVAGETPAAIYEILNSQPLSNEDVELFLDGTIVIRNQQAGPRKNA